MMDGAPADGGHSLVSSQIGTSSQRVLVVDDDPSIQLALTIFLESEGYLVQTAANGEEALEKMAQSRPSVVLLDMRMPIMDGWDFARIIRERGINVPVISMTAAQDAARWAAEIQAVAYVSKPFELASILSAIERVCLAA
jgi:CheY-like chemotaxis protein